MFTYQLVVTFTLFAFFALVVRNLRDYRKPVRFQPTGRPLVSICIPARNEEQNIVACLERLLAQDYSHFELLVLDDCSEDRTAEIVMEVAKRDGRVRLVAGKPILPGWAGKCHACAQLATQAVGEYLLFMDADTRAMPGLIGAGLALAEETQSDLVSAFPQQKVGSFWERVVLPMLQFLVVTLLPVRQVWESESPAFCAACGQFLLFRRDSYNRIGGHTAIRTSFHDGLQLARRLKTQGGQVYLFDASDLLQCRMYEGGRAVWNGFTRNAYEGLGSFTVLLVMTVILGGLFLAPFVFLGVALMIRAPWTLLCLVQVILLLLMRLLQANRFGHWISIPLFPLSLTALIAIQWGSLLRKNGSWKGRTYAKQG